MRCHPRRSREHRALPEGWRALSVLAVLGGIGSARCAEPIHPPPGEFSVSGTLTATDNGNLADDGSRRADLIGSLRPNLRWRQRGAGLDLDVDAGASFLGYANGTQRNSILPDVRATLRATVVDQWLKVDAATLVRQAETDVFGPRASEARGANRRTESAYDLRPHVERVLAPNTVLLAAYDLGLVTNGAGTGERTLSKRGVARVEHLPDPFGGAVEWSRADQEAAGDAQTQRVALQTARVSGNVALTHEWVLGVVAGQERSHFLQSDHTDTLYGIGVRWDPGPRTRAVVNLEHRFFGPGGTIEASHRTPFLSMGLKMARQPVLASPATALLDNGATLRTYLDAILTTRYPDEAARGEAVDALVRSQALDTRVQTSSDVASGYPQLTTEISGHVTFLGRRSLISLTWFSRTAQLLSHHGEPALQTVVANQDTRQVGAALDFSRRLAPQISATATVRWSRISGLSDRSGDVSRETFLRAALQRQVSRHWTVSAAIQHNNFSTNTTAQPSYRATAALVGAVYQF